jgi:hypoxanthine phosphoribosyltransferase
MTTITTLKSESEVRSRCEDIALKINEHYSSLVSEESPLMIIGILSGSFIFLADLVRLLHIPLEIHWVKVNSYEGVASSGRLNWQLNVNNNVNDHHILLVEDIIDTGLTLHEVMIDLSARVHPKSLKIASLLHKKMKTQYPVSADFLGFEIPDAFVVGLGLDYKGRYRELPFIGILEQ